MSWVVWRQHNREAGFAIAILGLLAAFMVFDSVQMSSVYRQLGLAACQGRNAYDGSASGQACGQALNSYMQSFFGTSVTVRYVLAALPGLLGMFVAAPLLAREVEHGTHMFIWTQSITRTRWFAVKVGLICSFTLVAAAAVAATAGWWHQPLELMYADGSWTFFEVIGFVPIAYAIFALALGIAAGTVLTRTVPAMATTLFIFVAVRAAIHWWRPWFQAPMTVQLPAPEASLRGALQITQNVGAANGLQTLVVYQPADRFWTFQTIETAIFLLLALPLIALTAWWLRHRVR
jgi:hypothetical protein